MHSFLVTGGAGFIGSHTAEELVRRGEKVRVLDNFSTGKRENLEPFGSFIELIAGDIRDQETCRRALKGVDFIFHLAAQTSVPGSISNPLLNHEINVNGTANLLLAARGAKAKRFVLASSAAVYGDSGALPLVEGSEGEPLSPYALSKVIGEKYCRLFYQLFGLETVSLRYFNVFGPRQDPFSAYASVIPLFVDKIISEERPQIFGDGEQSRDFLFVADAVEANLRAIEAPDEALGQVFNVGSGERTTVNGLVREICELTGVSVLPIYTDPRPGDILHSYADIGNARRVLGYEPQVGFKQGLKRTASWYAERK